MGMSFVLADRMISQQYMFYHQNRNVVETEPLDSNYVKRMIANKELTRCYYDVNCKTMAEAIYFEGRGESFQGQVAIAQVIKKRSFQRGMTVREIIYQKNKVGVCQFSYVCDIENKRISNKVSELKSWGKALKYAYGVTHDRYYDYSNGADHYFNPKTVSAIPEWSKKMTLVSSIKNHVFYLSTN